jgi:hypothetical protein
MSRNDDPKPEEKVCYNCRYMSWSVGVGMGIRCGHTNQWGLKIPGRFHSCDFFEFQKQ